MNPSVSAKMRSAGSRILWCLLALLLGTCVPVARSEEVANIPAEAAAPCRKAIPECSEWIGSDTKNSRLFVYRTHALRARNERLTRALIFVHGIKRDADNHFRTALAAAFLADVGDDTLIVAPRFASNSGAKGNEAGHCGDVLETHEANWVCDDRRTDTWRTGGTEVGDSGIASFDYMDRIVRLLADKHAFPNLRTIVIAGHSAGGQFVTRYEMTNAIHEQPGVRISYVVANPSSYVYLDDLRPTISALPDGISADAPGFRPPRSETLPAFASYPDARNCATYDDWPYGLQHRTGYAARVSAEQMRVQAAARPVTYLLGETDILPVGVFDVSCPAMAQGPTRLARGLAFARYINERHAAHHDVVVVPFCGHSARCLFTSDAAFPAVFPK